LAVVSIYARLKDKSRFVVNVIIYVNSYYTRRSRYEEAAESVREVDKVWKVEEKKYERGKDGVKEG